ncbi:hypothetical protein HDU78_004478 [Chytriomyces hyalinus]|nr:hypothetical protein HDU78_004478 [Chytriomyces hyalinus]
MTTPDITPVDQQEQQQQPAAVQHVDEIADAIAAAAAAVAAVAPAAESDSTTNPSIPQIVLELDNMDDNDDNDNDDDDACPEPNQVDIMFEGEMPTKKNFGKLMSNLKKTMSSAALLASSNSQLEPAVEGSRRKSFLSGLKMGKGAVDESVKDEFGKLFNDLDIQIRV